MFPFSLWLIIGHTHLFCMGNLKIFVFSAFVEIKIYSLKSRLLICFVYKGLLLLKAYNIQYYKHLWRKVR